MAGETSRERPDLLRQLTVPVALAVGSVVALAWYVTWSTSDLAMALMAQSVSLEGSASLVLFFALLVVMMIAMMLPSALPMIVTYHGITRLEAGRPVKPGDAIATAAFTSAYFVVWGAFAIVALLGLMALGVLGPLTGAFVLVPGATLVAAGVYQVTRTKDVCLRHCQSPMGFVMTHWRSGRGGALRMGLRHAAYCIGCCWLFMLVLFIAGSMSLLWMGALSLAILAEKVGSRSALPSRGISVVLLVAGAILAVQAFVSG